MMPLIDQIKNEIQEILLPLTESHPSLRLAVFPQLKKGTVTPLLQLNGFNEAGSFVLAQSVKIDRNVFLETATAEDENLLRFSEHFKLDGICKIPVTESQYQLLAVSSDGAGISDAQLMLINSAARQLSHLLENNHLRSELDHNTRQVQKLIDEMGALHEISRSIESSQNLDTLLRYIIDKGMSLMNSEAASMMLVVPGTDELEFKVVLGPKSEEVKPFRLKIGTGIAGWVAQHGEAILIPDAYEDPRFDPSFDKRSGFRTRSYLCVPLINKEKVIGVISVLNRMDLKPFGEKDKDLLTTFGSQAALAIENARLLQSAIEKERLDQELQVAAQIQQLLIPQELPSVPGLQISATYIPCKEVSGDFYDIIPINDHQFVFVVADVSGKGIPGAMLVSTMQASLKAYFEFSSDLNFVINSLNERVIRNTTEDRYITFVFGLYDSSSGQFKYINAGHNHPLLIDRDGSVRQLSTGGIFIGYTSWEYDCETLTFDENNILLMYTDGLVEAMNAGDEEFGEERLTAILKEAQNLPTAEIQQLIIDRINQHLGTNKLEDDFTLLVIKKV